MGITKRVWIQYRDTRKFELHDPIAIVGSPGLRSVGKIVVDQLVEKLQPDLFAELFSYGFPSIYYGPSYLGAPSYVGAQLVKDSVVELPRVGVYVLKNKSEGHVHGHDIVLIRGYQAYDAFNQYMVADTVADLLKELHTQMVISLGAQVIEEGVRCCATDVALLVDMSRYGIEKTQVTRFIGFSGLVTVIAKEKGIEGVCLFANTTQNLADPEFPDFKAATALLEKVCEIVELRVDTADLREGEREKGLKEKRRERESELSVEKERARIEEDFRGYA